MIQRATHPAWTRPHGAAVGTGTGTTGNRARLARSCFPGEGLRRSGEIVTGGAACSMRTGATVRREIVTGGAATGRGLPLLLIAGEGLRRDRDGAQNERGRHRNAAHGCGRESTRARNGRGTAQGRRVAEVGAACSMRTAHRQPTRRGNRNRQPTTETANRNAAQVRGLPVAHSG